jgi:hypothetical protein
VVGAGIETVATETGAAVTTTVFDVVGDLKAPGVIVHALSSKEKQKSGSLALLIDALYKFDILLKASIGTLSDTGQAVV